MVYQILSGKPKEILTQTRQRVEPLPAWRSLGMLNSNGSLVDTIATSKDNAMAELSRIIEMRFAPGLSVVPNNEMLRIKFHLAKHVGAVGRAFAPLVVRNRASYRTYVMELKNALDKKLNFGMEQRFWSIQLAVALAGGSIATKAGLLPFPEKPVLDWTINEAKTNRKATEECVFTPLDSFHRMITAYSTATINTEREGDARHDRMPVLINQEPLARVIRETGVMYLALTGVREWCRKKQIGYLEMKEAVHAAKLLLDDDAKFYLGKGTDRPTGQVRCWKIDWNTLQGV